MEERNHRLNVCSPEIVYKLYVAQYAFLVYRIARPLGGIIRDHESENR